MVSKNCGRNAKRVSSVLAAALVSVMLVEEVFAADFPPATVGVPYEGSAEVECDGSYGWTDSNGDSNSPQDIGLNVDIDDSGDPWIFTLTGTPTASQTFTLTTTTDSATLNISAPSSGSGNNDNNGGGSENYVSNDAPIDPDYVPEHIRQRIAEANKASQEESSPASNESSGTPAPQTYNPVSAVSGTLTTGNGMSGNITIYKQKQGELAEFAFNNARPAGWSTGFSFNLQVGYKTDSSLKQGEIKLNIPAEYLKSGGKYAIMGIDKDGNVKIFYDTDDDPNTITVDIDCEGYAFELIYK